MFTQLITWQRACNSAFSDLGDYLLNDELPKVERGAFMYHKPTNTILAFETQYDLSPERSENLQQRLTYLGYIVHAVTAHDPDEVNDENCDEPRITFAMLLYGTDTAKVTDELWAEYESVTGQGTPPEFEANQRKRDAACIQTIATKYDTSWDTWTQLMMRGGPTRGDQEPVNKIARASIKEKHELYLEDDIYYRLQELGSARKLLGRQMKKLEKLQTQIADDLPVVKTKMKKLAVELLEGLEPLVIHQNALVTQNPNAPLVTYQ